MLRKVGRVYAVWGLAALLLALTGGILGTPIVRSGAAQPSEAGPSRPAAPDALDFTIVLSQVVGPNQIDQPVGIANAGDGSGRLFVLEKTGYIRVIKNGVLLATPYLTIANKVDARGEQGLLGLEFDPDFETNRTFYINYNDDDAGGDTVIARYLVANINDDVANVINATPIITIAQPDGWQNHKGGDLHFGPDGYLYIGMGDGGGSNDDGSGHAPEGNGQAPGTLLGKMLRIHVRGVPTYTIPSTNPFTQTAGYKPEIWSLGWRNPWRFSFDRGTGDMYVGDVGQGCWEEISHQPAGSPGGENYGWRVEEGFRLFDPNEAGNCNMPVSTLVTTTKPITAYLNGNTTNSAVTGGFVYRGQQYPWLHGVYFYSDSGSGRIWAIQQTSPGVWSSAEKLDTPYGITAFGEDENGELYVADYSQGRILKITSPSSIDFSTSSKRASASLATLGDIVTYTVVVRNSGQPFLSTVRVTDTLPTGLSYVAGSLAATSGSPDASSAPTLKWNGVMSPTSIVTITFRALVNAASYQIITNTAAIDPALLPPLTRSAAITVTASGPDLSGSSKQASAASAQWNNVLTYTIVLRNSGQAFTQTVRVTDTLPAGLSYVAGSLTATRGAIDDSAAPVLKWNGDMSNTTAITISFRAGVTAFLSQTLTNIATINPGVGAPFNRSALVVVNGPDVTSSAKQASASTAQSGEVVSYTIVVRNTGGQFPATVRITDVLPSGLAYVPGSLTATSGAPDDSAAPTLKWSGVLSVTPIVTVSFAVSVTAPAATAIVNAATIHPGYGQPFPRTALIVANPHKLFLPLILRGN